MSDGDTDAFKLSYEGLERAAKAARELDKSTHAQAAVELSREAGPLLFLRTSSAAAAPRVPFLTCVVHCSRACLL